MAFFTEEVRLGVGEHFGNSHQLNNFTEILYWTFFHSWMLVIGISSVKLSVGFFLLRLVQGKWYKVSLMVPSFTSNVNFVAIYHGLDSLFDSFHACMRWNTRFSVSPSLRRLGHACTFGWQSEVLLN